MDNYLFITAEGDPLPIADRLIDEGKNVVVGLVEDPPTEMSPTISQKRDELYENVIWKRPAEEVLAWAKDLTNKQEWFVMFDYGDLWPWSERALEMGFSRGIFPTEEGYALESDRKLGKEFAAKHYPGVRVADSPEFKQVDEAIQFLNENPDNIYVLKSEGSNAETVVPNTQEPELARKQIEGALSSERAEYEKGGFTLEEKVAKPIEISPVMLFWDGKPLFSLVELENKGFGCGNIGRLTGGCQNLSIQTPINCDLNRIAFPPVIYEMASKSPGISIYDAGLLFDGREFLFTEFCSQRWGWDGIFSEMAMCMENPDSPFVSRHFDLIAQGRNPLLNKYGCAVRMFQTQPDGDLADVYQDGYGMDWMDEVSNRLFFYCLKREIDPETSRTRFVSVGYRKDLGVAVGASDYLEAAVDMAYEAAYNFAMTGVYYRPKFDFFCREYFTSIMNRYRWLINSGLLCESNSKE